MPRTTRSQGVVFALKTDLQRERDHYGFNIKKQWLPQGNRANQAPRNIELPDGASHYQHVVHHALMHTPIFIQWILGHNKPARRGHATAQCIMCAYKSLVHDYWLDAPNANAGQNLVAANHAGLAYIEAQLLLAHPTTFAHDRPGDAGLFYEWVTSQMENAILANPERQNQWHNEFKAIFQTDIEDWRRCAQCHAETPMPQAPVQTIEVDYHSTRTNLLQILQNDFFVQPRINAGCTNCGRFYAQNVYRKIVAAPQVLRIRVNIVHAAASGQTTKYLHGWDIPEQLDLTTHQVNAQLPLTYSLSSAIAYREKAHRYNLQLGAVPRVHAEYLDMMEESEDGMHAHGDLDPIMWLPGDYNEEDESLSDEDEDERELDEPCALQRSEGSEGTLSADGSDEDSRTISEDDFDEWNPPSEDSSDNDFFGKAGKTGADRNDSNAARPEPAADDYVLDGPEHSADVLHPAMEGQSAPKRHYMVNVRGPQNDFHISMSHQNNLQNTYDPHDTLTDNPQRPWHRPCYSLMGYQVVTLTYTRNKLTGNSAKLEKDVPSFV